MLNTILKIVFQNLNHLGEKIFGVLQDKNNKKKEKKVFACSEIATIFPDPGR